jgi:hypothetical protein
MGIGIAVLFATNPDIVWDTDNEGENEPVSSIERLDGTESVFKIVSSRGIQENTVKFEPTIIRCCGEILGERASYQIRQN